MSFTTTEYRQYTDYSVLLVTYKGQVYAINADWIPEDKKEWFSAVILSLVQDAYSAGQDDYTKEIQTQIKGLRQLLKV